MTYPTPQPAQPAERRFTIHYGFELLALFSLLGTVIPTIIMFAAAGDAANDPNGHAAGIGSGMAILWLLWGGMWTLIWTAFAIHHTLQGRRS